VIPVGLFKNALANRENRQQPVPSNRPPVRPHQVRKRRPYLGFAKYDFYILASEGTFALNFMKGAIGLWLRLAIVVGLGVVLSTYLSGVISFLTTMFIYVGGFFQDFIRDLAEGKNTGGGPMESLVRMVNREALVTPLQSTPGVNWHWAPIGFIAGSCAECWMSSPTPIALTGPITLPKDLTLAPRT